MTENRKMKSRLLSQLIVFPREQFTLILYGLVYILPVVAGVLVITLSTHLPLSGLSTFAFILSVIFVFLFLVLYGFLLTNRFVGPIYRLMKHMHAVLEGKETEPLVFRRDDYFADLAESYNKLLAHRAAKNSPAGEPTKK